MNGCKKSADKTQEIKHCAKCGKQFGCGVNGKCWCYEISLDDNALKRIEDFYDGCLCPDCLKAISNLSA
ncbi:MAG: cysteine-rich CWC family protein, partial [Bacteroidota bacterium]|nr:cysteine-rich CWC family protein [Bacteroidota bacterium]